MMEGRDIIERFDKCVICNSMWRYLPVCDGVYS